MLFEVLTCCGANYRVVFDCKLENRWCALQHGLRRVCPPLSDLCRQATKALFFFQLHTVVKLFFNDITIFETKHRYHLQPEDDTRCALTTTGPCFNRLVKQIQRHDSP